MMEAMDRPLDPQFKRRQRLRRAGIAVLVSGALVSGFGWLAGWVRPAMERDQIRTARVERGLVEAMLSASGTVVPATEQVIASPLDAEVLKVLKQAGEEVKKGQSLLELDRSQALQNLEKLEGELALNQNRQAQVQVDLDKTLNDLQSKWKLQDLELQARQSKETQDHRLYELGLISAERLRQAGIEAQKAAIELDQLASSIRDTRQSLQTQLEGLALEMKTLAHQRDEAQRQLALAQVPADRDGVLTWVTPEEGAVVRKGEPVARLADLGSFRVKASISDVHIGRLAVGMPAKVRLGEDTWLGGRIAQISPTIENRAMSLEVELEEKAHPGLRANLRVDVYVVTARKEGVLRLKKGPFIKGGEGEQEVFVLRGDEALRRTVRIGLASAEHYEVVEGLSEGDEVVISEVKDFIHLQRVKVN